MSIHKHSGLFPKQKASIDYILKDMKRNNYPWIKKIILFGSCAKNSNKFSSDVDILFITSNEYTKFKDEMHHVKCVLCGLPDDEYAVVDPKFISEDYFLTQQTTFLSNIRKEGVVLWTHNLI